MAAKDNARAILSYATPNPVGPYRLVTPPKPDLAVGKTKTPILPVMGGTLVNLPTPVMPTKQTTPVAPPLPGRLVNVPTQQGRVVDKSYEDDLIELQKESKRSDKVYNNSVGWLGQSEKVALIDIYRRTKNYIDTTSDPYWKSIYETSRKELSDKGEGAQDAHQGAIEDVLDKAAFAKKYGVKRTALPILDKNNVYAFDDLLVDSPTARKSFGKLTDREQETAISLAEGWTGSAMDLIKTARSLSK